MAKVIQYKADTNRKPGFKKVRREDNQRNPSQLNLFVEQTADQPSVQVLRHLDPFEKALRLDGKNDALTEKLYLEAIENDISTADAYCNLGIIYARRGDTVKAIDFLTRALKYDPRHMEAHYNLANMYYDAGNHALARMHYEVAVEFENAFPEINFNLALTHVCLNDPNKAIKQLENYIDSTSSNQHAEAVHLMKMLSLQLD